MSLIRRYKQILEGLLIELNRHYGQRLVACAVFGSVGRGTPRHDSDIDLLLVVRDLPRGRLRRVEEFLPVESLARSHLVKAQKRLKVLAVCGTRVPIRTWCGRPRNWWSWR